MSPRARLGALTALLAVIMAAFVTCLLSIRAAVSSAPVYVNSTNSAGALWAFDGAGYSMVAGRGGPRSNSVDLAFDRSSGVVVAWDHGCARLVMGFTGGCLEAVNQTWTWDGASWRTLGWRGSPVAAGPGALLYDRGLGRVLYVNGAGQAWSFDGRGWAPVPLPGGPSVPRPGSYAGDSLVAVGYDEARGALVYVLADRTWLWDGRRWTSEAGGIAPAEARFDRHAVYDPARAELVYVGARATWSWDGARWARHDQPDLASAVAGYGGSGVLAVAEDASACGRRSCATLSWAWNGATWQRVAATPPLSLSLTRAGAASPATTYDEARQRALFLVTG